MKIGSRSKRKYTIFYLIDGTAFDRERFVLFATNEWNARESTIPLNQPFDLYSAAGYLNRLGFKCEMQTEEGTFPLGEQF